jgi:hypothetical protein
MKDNFHADGHIPVQSGKGHANPADRFESIHEWQVKIRLGFRDRNRDEQITDRIGFVIDGVRWHT